MTSATHPGSSQAGARPSGPRVDRGVVAVVAVAAAGTVVVGRDGSPPWQAAPAVAVVAIAIGVVLGTSRLGPRWRGVLLGAVGSLSLAAGVGLAPHVVKGGLSATAVSALVLVLAGLALVGAGGHAVLRGRGRLVGVLGGVAAGVATALVAFVVGPPVAATNVPRPAVDATPASVGLEYDSVTLITADGVELAAWYVTSANRAAIVLRHGAGSTRSDVLHQAAVLARRGFGVLLVDARGHGESEGRAMDFGWHGDADIAAGVAYLATRPDVDPNRIALVGMSMGGEEAIGASATNPSVVAVVAEGATARNAEDEEWLSDAYGARGTVQEQLERLQDLATDLLTSASVPVALRDAVGASGGTRYLLVTAGDVNDEGRAAAHIAAAAPDRTDIWTVPGAGHTEGLASAPDEWERRVAGFLEDALGVG